MADAPIATSINERTVSNWAAPAVSGLVSDALSTYNEPYYAYGGAQVAEAQPLQTQAFQGLGGLATPTAVTGAANYLNTAAGAQAPTYQGSTFGNQYATPSNVYAGTTVGSTFTAPGAYQPTGFNAGFNAPAPYQQTGFNAGFNAPGTYQGSNIASTFNAPAPYQQAGFTSGFNAPGTYQGSNIASTFQAPGAYQTGTFNSGITPGSIQGYQGSQFSNQFNYDPTNISTGLGAVGSVQSYMNPYIQNVVDVQGREARRQADISRMADAGRLAKAGAYGGSRQAVIEAEGNRNLATQLGDITAKGYQSAYDTALKQRLAESGLSMEAQKATESGRQFGAEGRAKYGLEAQKAQELSRQFAYDKGVLGVKELEAKYGLEAQKATEASRQFGAGQAMTAADLKTRYGLDAAKANELSRQFGSQQAMTAADLQSRYGLDAQKATELSRQFGAQQALSAADLKTRYGLDAAKANELSRQFGAQQSVTVADLQSRYGLDAQKATELSRQFGAQQAMSAADLQSRYGLDAQKAADLSRQFGAQQALASATTAGAQKLEASRITEQSKQEAARQAQAGSEAAARYGLAGLQAQEQSRQFGAGLAKDYSAQQLAAAKDLGYLGISQGDQQLRQLQAQLAGGETQRNIEQAGLTADYRDFLEQRGWEASQQAGLASLLKQFPMETQNTYGQAPDPLTSILGGGITGYALLQKLLGSTGTGAPTT